MKNCKAYETCFILINLIDYFVDFCFYFIKNINNVKHLILQLHGKNVK